MNRSCNKHGLTPHSARKEGGWRCRACECERIAEKRRDIKRKLVAERGGRCEECGYDRYEGALQFHHRDPTQKSFGISAKGYTRSWSVVKEEADKCVLLCGNCHDEVEAGLRVLAT
jgi:predicted Zn-ribbon and HTH transcriptional regulator